MSVLTSTYGYQQGDLIVFWITAFNEIGSVTSSVNTGMVNAQVPPL